MAQDNLHLSLRWSHDEEGQFCLLRIKRWPHYVTGGKLISCVDGVYMTTCTREELEETKREMFQHVSAHLGKTLQETTDKLSDLNKLRIEVFKPKEEPEGEQNNAPASTALDT